jgi:DNA-binding transcriptional LysR family regulator
MERQQIEVFLTLAQELHFGRTAERLHLSQARISQSIKRSEIEIGAPLFRRTSRRVELTSIGEQLNEALAPAHASVLHAIASTSSAARRVRGKITVGFLGPLAGDLIVRSAASWRQDHHDAEIELRATEIAEPLRPLRAGEVDMLLTQLPVDEPGLLSDEPMIEERRVLAIASAHPLAARRSVTLEDLAGDRIFRPAGKPSRDWLRSYQPWTTPSGTPIERGPAVETFGELLVMIAAGEGVCTVAGHNETYHPRPGVTYVPIEDASPFQFGFVWRAGSETALSVAVLAAVRRCVDDLGGPANVATAFGETSRI